MKDYSYPEWCRGRLILCEGFIMDHRGHPRPDPVPHSHRTKDREDYHRYSQQDRDHSYQPPNPREGDRHWAQTDARYRTHFTSPPARPEQYPHNAQQYPYGYGRPELQRPQSRHGYDYPPHSQWDYRDNYGYYDHDYYRGQSGQQDAGQWGAQDSSRTAPYPDRTYKHEPSGSSYTDEHRYDQGRGNSQHYLNPYEDNPSRDNEEVSSYYLGTLEHSKNSGLSSSSYELSQYINGAEHSEPAPQSVHTSDAEHGPMHQTSAPLKYSIPHVVVSFGPAGQLIRVTPGLSTQEKVSQLEIHSLEVILGETKEQQEMRCFPGPLTREDLHKVDAIDFAHQRAGACMSGDELHDKSSAALLWNLLILLCRQNAQLVGSDIAELLMQGSHSDGSWESDAPTLIDFGDGTTAEAPPRTGDDLLTGTWSSFSSEKALQSYTQLLLAGRKKEALDSAMSSGLWGHALFLASKMDNRSYTTVLNRFTGQLTASDPLQTLFHLLTGRIPVVSMCCGTEKWGNWRPHLAVMLSNETGDPAVQQKAIVTMGDTLASKGLLHAAHVCYLTAGVPFGVFTQKAERLVLLGSSHRQSFEYFATNLAIQCTELYEYCQSLGGKCLSLPSFQVYKFLYASRLLDCGLASQAFHYCEVVGRAILRQREPFFVLTGEVVKLSDRLRNSEGQFSEAGVSGAGQEPNWLRQLRAMHHSLQTGGYDCTETYQPPPGESALAHEGGKVSLESHLNDLNRDIQSPEPELLYYRGTGDQANLEHQVDGITEEMNVLSWDDNRAQDWPHANSPMPVPLVYAPPAPTVTASQAFSYHNTDSAEVRAASPHCPLSSQPSAAEGAGSFSRAGTMGVQMLEVNVSRQGQFQQSGQQGSEGSEQTSGPPKQSTKAGWFSGWFKSKPKDLHEESSEQRSPAQMELPPTTGFSPPPPPAMFPPQPSSAGINPFSRKAAGVEALSRP
ncbi:protein transport protein Sec16B isoform X1 [Anarrhichthys ocellatus]|uniref:protein transport protein Sec16B isoform X1 n=2 Tax=Anarrhichthys ocellatus TaxID=433405 RepID=UPI0012EDE322|nr:protein transport protein Sec16B-like isoform X1 [Anarrhichthys ocellatus]XP_031728891.1 protein transport protein Sec16B-like isoform X1 [Anarrhichthys ocellatus]